MFCKIILNGFIRTYVHALLYRVGVDYYMLLYSTVDKQVCSGLCCLLQYMYMHMYIHLHVLQIAAAVRHHTSDYGKGDIPSYQLYLHLGDILKLSVNISSEYVANFGIQYV